MMIQSLHNPNFFAVSCELTKTQLTAEMLYIKELTLVEAKVNLYNSDRELMAVVIMPPLTKQNNSKITLEICP